MTPQSSVFVLAPLKPEREADLRALLTSMNRQPGQADPRNPLVPFADLPQVHYARFAILKDETLDDIHTAYGLPRVDYPVNLAFLADIDGPADDFRRELVRCAQAGLDKIFSCCEGYRSGADLAQWMKQQEAPSAANYVNWIGRTAGQVREENELRLALEAELQRDPAAFAGKSPREIHFALGEFVRRQVYQGRLRLTPPARTPVGWWIRNLLHAVGGLLLAAAFLPLFLLYLPIFVLQLRLHEKSDPEIAPRVTEAHEDELSNLEDYDVTNQFTVMGSVKPGLFRRWTLAALLSAVNWAARHLFNRGHLARVSTIHFARWVFINGKRRVVFASNYDGSLESYMDDFINKVGWGLNLSFSAGIGYPRTRWMVLDGSKREQKFKYVLRRHELPTEVWYKAYPGLTAFDLKRNARIRQGIDQRSPTEEELREWVALL